MIQLNTAAIPSLFALKSPPLYAVCTSVLAIVQPWSGGMTQIVANYQYGNVDGSGNFTPDPTQPIVEVKLPEAQSYADHVPAIAVADQSALLTNLLSGGVAPTVGAPTTAQTVAGKPAGEFRVVDIDAIVAFEHAALLGTVVAQPTIVFATS